LEEQRFIQKMEQVDEKTVATAGVFEEQFSLIGDTTSEGMTIVGEAVVENMDTAEGAVKAAMTQIETSIQTGVTTATATIRKGRTDFFAAGQFLASGLEAGIRSKIKAIASAAAAVVRAAIAAAKAAAQNTSPSRIMTIEGGFFGEGFAIGILSKISAVERASGLLIEAATPSLSLNNRIPNTPALSRGNFSESGMAQSIIVEGGININIETQPGDSPEDIAEEVADVLSERFAGLSRLHGAAGV
jgi:hypothetical protein